MTSVSHNILQNVPLRGVMRKLFSDNGKSVMCSADYKKCEQCVSVYTHVYINRHIHTQWWKDVFWVYRIHRMPVFCSSLLKAAWTYLGKAINFVFQNRRKPDIIWLNSKQLSCVSNWRFSNLVAELLASVFNLKLWEALTQNYVKDVYRINNYKI